MITKYVCIDVATQRSRMAISKVSEAIYGQSNGEGGTLSNVLVHQPDMETIINGSFFYFEKMKAVYNVDVPEKKAIGEGIGLCKIRDNISDEDIDESRFGYLVQEKRGDSFQLLTNASKSFLRNCKYVLSCSPVLLREGKCIANPCKEKEKEEGSGPPGHLGHLFIPNPRSMIGKRANGDIVLAVSTTKMVFNEMQKAMMKLGCVTAFALDGGGSSFLWHNGHVLHENETDRKIGNMIVVFK